MKTHDELYLSILPLPNSIQEYMKKLGDGYFEICDECSESNELFCYSSEDHDVQDDVPESSAIDESIPSRRCLLW